MITNIKIPAIIITVIGLYSLTNKLNALPQWINLSAKTTSTSTATYTPYVASFDGTNDTARQTVSSPSGLPVDSSRVECSFWVKFNGGDNALQQIFRITNSSDDTPRFSITRTADNKIAFYGAVPAGTSAVSITSTSTITSSSGWVHVYLFADTTNTAVRGIYINGISDTLNIISYVSNAVIDYNGINYRYTFGGSGVTTSVPSLNASLADFYWNDSVSCTIGDFYNNGEPVDLGLTGQLPSGTAPVFYLSKAGNGNSWATNSGTGGNFTVTGSLTTEPF